MVSLVCFDILQLLHTVISNSEKLTHPNGQSETLNSGRGSPLLLPIMLSHYRTQTTAHVLGYGHSETQNPWRDPAQL